MRARLFLSVAITALSLGIAPSYAQNTARDQTGGEPPKPAKEEPATHHAKPAEPGAREQHGEMQNRERGEVQGERKAGPSGANEPGEKAARSEERRLEEHGAAAKHGEKKDERHGAVNENAEQTPNAKAERRQHHGARQTPAGHPGAETQGAKAEKQGAKEPEKQEKTGRAGVSPNEGAERTGPAATENERQRAASPEQRNKSAAERAPGAAERAPGAAERTPGAGELTPGQEMKRGAEATPQGGVQGRETYGYAGREAQRGGVQLNARQESRVRDIIEQRGAQRISRNEFDPRIGVVAPPNVTFAPLPPEVVSIVPQYRGYDFVQVENEIAIIDPSDRRVVSLLDVGGPMPGGSGYYEEREGRYGGGYERREGGRYGAARGREYGQREGGGAYGRRERGGETYGYAPRVRLDARQERALYRGVMRQARENLRQVCVHVGDRVPDSVDLAPVPRNVALDAPDIERYDYFVLNDQVVLVDPDSHVVVDIVEEPK
ncbi:DUF1236 domain-containing protein [Methylocystis sp. MJC1]|uniref:DUF1236 domain-containing protein n=1 Tax=Methylocystis sp. MJC1 TaxID=2654282 RepID=UPI0013EDC0C3|nr:DUF1236 domain-containing protein [Methylocystis sp. MJC1]KAF2990081.1 hypothetical protein MJC1_02741 [Methylocystis sp. MJC1]MBU6527662.1 DUF1236 domain-containing protein [Methylocystis sp. MJC1]UZX10599.1 DUF1236 domain-containing protein [Methylocystis sp. MJC1]